MDDYIRREDAINAVLGLTMYKGLVPVDSVLFNINEVKSADVREVVRGRWLTKEYMYGDPNVGIEDMWIDRLAEQSDYYAYCSICNKDAEYNAEGSLILSDYCPNCGARMDGEVIK